MNTRTYSITVAASRSRVFAYLADIENLPQWATNFCHRLDVVDGAYWVTNDGGRVLCRIAAHEPTGTIDYLAGPTDEQMALWPARVLALPSGESLFQFTAVQLPLMSDAEFAGHCAGLQDELRNVARALEPVAA